MVAKHPHHALAHSRIIRDYFMKHPLLLLASRSTKWKAASCLSIAAFADFCLFNHPTGWTAGLFVLIALMLMLLHNAHILRSHTGIIAIIFLAGQSLVMIENPNILSVTLITIGAIILSILSRHAAYTSLPLWLKALGWFGIESTARLIENTRFIRNLKRKGKLSSVPVHWLKNWCLPLLSAGLFLSLFSEANPIISQWTDRIQIAFLWNELSLTRICFWFSVFCLSWSVLRSRVRYITHDTSLTSTKNNAPSPLLNWLFSYHAVLRALITCNILFFFQTSSDILYLWGGAHLPEGITYAAYAQRGAYPLIVTALLAAGFVLIALRPNSETVHNTWILRLIALWIGQNILMVCSAMMRLKLYVDVYSLTHLRLIAFIWMALICAGLALIIIRMLKHYTNAWLIKWNLALACYALYGYSIADTNQIIAEFNVDHCYEMAGAAHTSIDLTYLASLGTSALPALHRLQPHLPYSSISHAKDIERSFINTIQDTQNNWRTWTWRNYRLHQWVNSYIQPKMLVQKSVDSYILSFH
jgi:hypothetical protein